MNNVAENLNNPTLSSEIALALKNRKIVDLVTRTLAEDLSTFHVKEPVELARMTMEKLVEAKENYPMAATQLALEVYPRWRGQEVRKLYHDYNWAVERKGSAEVASPHIKGKTLVDIGGGPGTFPLELLKLPATSELSVTIADIEDWRNADARSSAKINYEALTIGGTLPFRNDQFDSGSLLYVLHHVETDHEEFLKECERCIRKTLILFEDVRVDTSNGIPRGEYRPARSLEANFISLSLTEQNQFIAAVDYICNHIASQALNMPVPGKYYELRELEEKLKKLFPTASVNTHYHGIYDRKCYPNPEAMFVVDFNKGAK